MTHDTGFLDTTRTFYDTIAEDYADLHRATGAGTPLDRALMGAFAELVGPEGEVADLGCGPGRVTAHLASLGLRVFGLDLSAAMLEIARALASGKPGSRPIRAAASLTAEICRTLFSFATTTQGRS